MEYVLFNLGLFSIFTRIHMYYILPIRGQERQEWNKRFKRVGMIVKIGNDFEQQGQ